MAMVAAAGMDNGTKDGSRTDGTNRRTTGEEEVAKSPGETTKIVAEIKKEPTRKEPTGSQRGQNKERKKLLEQRSYKVNH